MFELSIKVRSIEEAELYLDHLRACLGSDPALGAIKPDAAGPDPIGAAPVELPAYLQGAVAAIQALQGRRGLAAMGVSLGVLARFRVGNVRELAPADCAAFVLACNAA